MIDTVRFEVPAQGKPKNMLDKFVEHSKIDHENGNVKFRCWSKDLDLGSYDSNINIFYDDVRDRFFLEFSVPKYHFGHNIFLIYPSEYRRAIINLYYDLVDFFGYWPHPNYWKYRRIDVCYAWKFDNDEIVEGLLSILKTYNPPRKKRMDYPTSCMWAGKIYSFKWYLKHPEFLVHDFRKLRKREKTVDTAYRLLDYAKGVLRFETTVKYEKLIDLFGSDLSYENITDSKFENLLHEMYNIFMANRSSDIQTAVQIVNILKSKYKTTRAIQLYAFYCLYHSENKEDQQILKNTYSRTQIYRNLKLIKDAGVGIKLPSIDLPFALKIPSEFVPNEPEALAPAIAGDE